MRDTAGRWSGRHIRANISLVYTWCAKLGRLGLNVGLPLCTFSGLASINLSSSALEVVSAEEQKGSHEQDYISSGWVRYKAYSSERRWEAYKVNNNKVWMIEWPD